MEPVALRLEQLNDVHQVPMSLLAASARVAAGNCAIPSSSLSSSSCSTTARVLSMLNANTSATPSVMPPYDPTCPVSVAMSKLASLMDHADPVAAAAAAAEEEAAEAVLAAAAQNEKEKEAKEGDKEEGEEKKEKVNEEEEEENEVPLECLRFFKLLNRGSQRSLMKQLISQLQRTACTPRDSLMGLGEATPRFLDASVSTSLGG